jgi:signal transduction histidine kinase
MKAPEPDRAPSRSLYLGVLLAVNVAIVGLMWRFREVSWILVPFSVMWVLLVTAFAWELITRADHLDRIVGSRTGVLEDTNRLLTQVLEQLRAFHRISYEINQKIALEEIAQAFTDRLQRSLPQIDAVRLWLDRSLLRDDGADGPVNGGNARPLELAGRAGEGFGEPEELGRLAADNPLVSTCLSKKGVTLTPNLSAKAQGWGWSWLASAGIRSSAAFCLHLEDRLLGALVVFSRRDLSPEFIRQLHLCVNQLSVALEKARLLKRMRTRADELAAANEELRELDAMKNWFVSTVSHELRTPLTNIRSFSEILENYQDLDASERREFAGIIRDESERLSDMISNVLDLAKIANGEVDLDPVPMDLGAVVGRCCRLFSQEAQEKRITFRSIIPPRPPVVEADENAVARVLNNLLGNAFKFTSEGGEITVTVGVSAAGSPRFATVLVRDTGMGIALEDQQRIFEKFTQAGGRLTDKPPGTGIGLAICREIVGMSGGRIWVRSKPGEGSTFGFTLPMVEAIGVGRPAGAETAVMSNVPIPGQEGWSDLPLSQHERAAGGPAGRSGPHPRA